MAAPSLDGSKTAKFPPAVRRSMLQRATKALYGVNGAQGARDSLHHNSRNWNQQYVDEAPARLLRMRDHRPMVRYRGFERDNHSIFTPSLSTSIIHHGITSG